MAAFMLERVARVAGSPDAVGKEKADLGRVVIECGLVEAVERRDVKNDRDPKPAPP